MGESLRIENLYVRFGTPGGQVKALNGVDLVLEEEQVYCLVGESGAGKSTIALAIMGLLPRSASVNRGSIIFNGVDLLKASPEYLRNLRVLEISMVFQVAQAALNPGPPAPARPKPETARSSTPLTWGGPRALLQRCHGANVSPR